MDNIIKLETLIEKKKKEQEEKELSEKQRKNIIKTHESILKRVEKKFPDGGLIITLDKGHISISATTNDLELILEMLYQATEIVEEIEEDEYENE